MFKEHPEIAFVSEVFKGFARVLDRQFRDVGTGEGVCVYDVVQGACRNRLVRIRLERLKGDAYRRGLGFDKDR